MTTFKFELVKIAVAVAFAAVLTTGVAAGEKGDPFELAIFGGGKIAMQKSGEGFKFDSSNLNSGANGKKGKTPVLFAFFATWCPPCKAEIPLFNDLAARYEGKLLVVGVMSDVKPDAFVEKFVKMHKVRYPLAVRGAREFSAELGDVIGTPYTLLLASDGSIAAKYIGHTDEKELESKIKKLVK